MSRKESLTRLSALFPEGGFRFSMRFERGRPEEFFAGTSDNAALLAERRKWLAAGPGEYAALVPEGSPLVEETIEIVRGWGRVSLPEFGVGQERAWNNWLALSSSLEPDMVLLKRDPAGEFRLVAGAVCFPSHWSLAEKAGGTMSMIHGPVPGLNEAIGKQINGFLEKLRPGVAWLRSNSGLARHAELNDHPSRGLARLDGSVRVEEVWLRVEHQALVALPKTGGVLFGIRVAVHSLAEMRDEPVLAGGLVRALETMPEEMARYKGLGSAREALVRLLRNEEWRG